MSLDDEFRGSSLKAHTALNADDGVAHIAVTANGIAGSYLLDFLNGLHLVVERLSVDGHNLTLFEGNLQQRLLLLGSDMLQIGILGKSLRGVEQFAATDAGAPDSYVVRILQLGEVGIESVLVQVVHLFLTGELFVACQRNNLHARSHHQEGHVETYLVVAGACRAVGNRIGPNLFGITGDGDGLEDALRTDRDGVAVVAKHIAEDHIFQRLFVVLVGNVERYVFHGAQLVGVLLVLFQLFGTKTACVGTGCIYLIAILREFHYGVGCIQAARKGDYHFLLVCHNIFVFFVVTQ